MDTDIDIDFDTDVDIDANTDVDTDIDLDTDIGLDADADVHTVLHMDPGIHCHDLGPQVSLGFHPVILKSSARPDMSTFLLRLHGTVPLDTDSSFPKASRSFMVCT